MTDVTHVVHWIPPELERTRKWFGRQASPYGYWELQPLDAWEAGRHDTEILDYMTLEDPDSCGGREAEERDLAASASQALGYPVTLEEDKEMNGKGIWLIPGWHHPPLRWLDAPVYYVRPAG
jgi:hypothetical protein